MIENIVTMISTGLMTGIVMFQKRWVMLAPSMAAASYRSGEIVCSPARSVMP